ncbi:manganese/iron ABC transporter ATP-binding protein [Treponema socranskii]|uniref:manganese/iron ABC transporter ATP-binding protein n=1 Tax=Treponema socranskii TaxID=53419 RepID=UPI003D93BB3D
MNTDREVPVELAVQNVSVAYNNGHVALYDASFRLQKGTITALVGVNGSGKSTLFKTIMGFIKPMSGSVTICSEPVRQAQKHRLLAYVPQSEEVDWSFPVSVWDVVMMGRYGYMNFLRIPNKEDKEIAERSLERVQMLEFKDRQIGELSGGQKKRVFLARALAQRGKIILLDEPFTGVDVKTETAIIDLLRELKNDGHLIFVSTHDLGSVPEFCDHVVIINKTVLAAGPTETTFTADNLIKAFGGALRSIKLDHTDNPEDSTHEFRVFTDDEGALITKREGKPYRRGIRNIEAALPK